MSKILMYSEAWGRGGIETFIKNILPGLIKRGHQVDIFSTWDWGGLDDSELRNLGVCRTTVFHGFRPGQLRRLIEGPKSFRKVLEQNHYDAVWVNTMNGMGFQFSREAEAMGVPMRVVHSHNSDVGNGCRTLKRAISGFGTFLWGGSSTRNVACSEDAGVHLFKNRPFEVINNGIDIERFRYSDAKRALSREELGVSPDVTLIGNIGRISKQKNPLFQVRVFNEYLKLDPSAKYLMIGQADMADEVEGLVDELGCADSFILHGPVDDTSPYYCALDAFLMPSLFEGLGLVRVEAQCSSLPILSTDTMPVEADITEISQHCSLQNPPKIWAKRLHELVGAGRGRRCGAYADRVAAAGFSAEDSTEKVLDILGKVAF